MKMVTNPTHQRMVLRNHNHNHQLKAEQLEDWYKYSCKNRLQKEVTDPRIMSKYGYFYW